MSETKAKQIIAAVITEIDRRTSFSQSLVLCGACGTFVDSDQMSRSHYQFTKQVCCNCKEAVDRQFVSQSNVCQ